jgi:hypothetical protein
MYFINITLDVQFCRFFQPIVSLASFSTFISVYSKVYGELYKNNNSLRGLSL